MEVKIQRVQMPKVKDWKRCSQRKHLYYVVHEFPGVQLVYFGKAFNEQNQCMISDSDTELQTFSKA